MMKSVIALLITTLLIPLEVSTFAQKKRQTRKPSPLAGYITGHFDSKIDKLPPNFKGHYIEGVFLAVRGLTPPKGEYEKTDQYVARLAQYVGNNQYAFRFDPEIDKGWVSYNADSETLKVSGYSVGVFASEMTHSRVTLELNKTSHLVDCSRSFGTN